MYQKSEMKPSHQQVYYALTIYAYIFGKNGSQSERNNRAHKSEHRMASLKEL